MVEQVGALFVDGTGRLPGLSLHMEVMLPVCCLEVNRLLCSSQKCSLTAAAGLFLVL